MSEINPNSSISSSAWVATLKNFANQDQGALPDQRINQLSLKQIEQVTKTFAKESSPDVKEMAALIKGIAQASNQKKYSGINKITKLFTSLFQVLQGKGFKTTEDRLLDLAKKMEKDFPVDSEKPLIAPEQAKPSSDAIITYVKGETPTAQLVPTNKNTIGTGAFGGVHIHREDKNLVVKKSHHNITREFELGHKLDHPCIAKSQQLYIKQYTPGVNGTYKLVMDKIEGTNIHQQKLPSDKISSLLKETKDTVKYLFEQNIYWQDVNATNIFVTQDGHLKICDLGFWGEEQKTSILTKKLLLGAMELSRWILTASEIFENVQGENRTQILGEIFKPKEFFGSKVPTQNNIYSLADREGLYNKEPWMKFLQSKINKMKPNQQLTFLQKYMDCVITNFKTLAKLDDKT